jgi:hypothetical protein
MNWYKSVIRKLRTALGLSPAERSLFIKAWFWLLTVDLLLRSQPFPRVQQFVDRKKPTAQEVTWEQAWELIRRTQRFVLLAARYHLYPMSCLRQALTLKKLLGAEGIATQLRFGVRKEPQQLLAHAWLEYEGHSIELAHPGQEHYAPLTSPGGSL